MYPPCVWLDIVLYRRNKSAVNGETVNETTNTTPWGRVDETNTVYVREGDSERVVGQFPDGNAEEALAYFTRKFDELAGQVHVLEQRINSGSAGMDVTQSVDHLAEQLREPAAVGDIQALRDRVTGLRERADEFVEKQRAERAARKQAALEERESIVTRAEEIANQPEEKIRWKESGKTMEELFAQWQAAQRQGPQIPKSEADALWKRFRTARTKFDASRRKFFAQMDATNKEVKQRKERIIAAAEALAPKGSAGIGDYRKLLDDWKAAGRASRKVDDQLWERFKAAGDVLYAARAEETEQENKVLEENLIAKRALLEEASPIRSLNDHEQARKQLTDIQLRWDAIGHVPRSALREVESKLSEIENHVRSLEDEHWQATNPETLARSEGLKGQLEDSIAQLKDELSQAQAQKDQVKVRQVTEALETQESWLRAIS